jgi:hypothetical protein
LLRDLGISSRCPQHPAWKHPHQIDRQVPANRFDVLRRRTREQDSNPVRHLAVILAIIEQYDDDLGVKFGADLIGHTIDVTYRARGIGC